MEKVGKVRRSGMDRICYLKLSLRKWDGNGYEFYFVVWRDFDFLHGKSVLVFILVCSSQFVGLGRDFFKYEFCLFSILRLEQDLVMINGHARNTHPTI